jgi:hypothetical protein
MNREKFPNEAFALIKEIGGRKFKLLRHHTEEVKDGNESNTINENLLQACLKAVEYIELPESEKSAVIEHLETHATRLLEINEETAKQLMDQQDGGETTKEDVVMTEEDFPADQDLTPKDASNTEIPIKEMTDTPASPKVIEDDPTIKTTMAAVWTTAFVNNLPDSSFAVVEKGGEKDEEGKTVPRNYRHLPYKDTAGKIDLPHLRNALARMNQIKAASTNDSTERIRQTARRVLVSAAKKHLPGSKFAKGEDLTEEKIDSLNDQELNSLTLDLVRALDISENDDKKNVESLEIGEVIQDIQGLTITPKAKKALFRKFQDAVNNKATAKIHSIEKVGNIEFILLRLGEDEDFPVVLQLEIIKDAEDKVRAVRLMGEFIPGEALSDFSKFLKSLTT